MIILDYNENDELDACNKTAAKHIKELRKEVPHGLRESISFGEEYLKEHPGAVRVMCSLGESYLHHKQSGKAEQLYLGVLSGSYNGVKGGLKNHEAANKGYIRAALTARRWEAAVHRWERARELLPEAALPSIEKARALAAAERGGRKETAVPPASAASEAAGDFIREAMERLDKDKRERQALETPEEFINRALAEAEERKIKERKR